MHIFIVQHSDLNFRSMRCIKIDIIIIIIIFCVCRLTGRPILWHLANTIWSEVPVSSAAQPRRCWVRPLAANRSYSTARAPPRCFTKWPRPYQSTAKYTRCPRRSLPHLRRTRLMPGSSAALTRVGGLKLFCWLIAVILFFPESPRYAIFWGPRMCKCVQIFDTPYFF